MKNRDLPYLTVIVGPMFSEKSTELIRITNLAKIAKLKTVHFKPSRDTRTDQEIKSRNNTQLSAITIEHSKEIFNHIDTNTQIISIDEGHFFDEQLPTVIMTLIRQNIHVFIAGLDLDYREHPFPVMSHLMALADDLRKMQAVCSVCGSFHATRSQRLIDCSDTIMVGDQEYEPRCLKCYQPPTN